MLVGDEDDLRGGLRALSSAPPPPPDDRVAASVRRARQIRRRRAAAASVAVLVPAVLVGTRLAWPAPERRVTPVAQWPDARDRSLDAYGDLALAAWSERSGGLFPGESVRWLYSGRVPQTDTPQVVVVFATCTADACSRLVMQHAVEEDARDPDDDRSMSSWGGETYDLVSGAPAPPVSAYLAGFEQERGTTNVLFVYAGPDAARVTYASPAHRPATGGSGDLPRSRTAFAGEVGYLSAPATITVFDIEGDVIHQGVAGEPGDVPRVRRVDEVEIPPGFDRLMATSGQADGRTGFGNHAADAPYAVFARCRGDAPLELSVDGRAYRVTCDDRQRQVTPVLPKPRDRAYLIEIDSDDPFTAYAIAVAVPD